MEVLVRGAGGDGSLSIELLDFITAPITVYPRVRRSRCLRQTNHPRMCPVAKFYLFLFKPPPQGMKAAIGQAMTGLEPESVGAMAVSGQQHGLVVVDEAGQVRARPHTSKMSELFRIVFFTILEQARS